MNRLIKLLLQKISKPKLFGFAALSTRKNEPKYRNCGNVSSPLSNRQVNREDPNESTLLHNVPLETSQKYFSDLVPDFVASGTILASNVERQTSNVYSAPGTQLLETHSPSEYTTHDHWAL